MCNICKNPAHTDDLDDQFDDIFGPAAATAADISAADAAAFAKSALASANAGAVARAPTTTAKEVFTEPCKKCRGSGRFIAYTGRVVGPCHACKGKGTTEYKTSPEERQRRAEKKAFDLVNAIKAWSEAHDQEWVWMLENQSRFGFASEMVNTVRQKGSLSAGQLAAVQKLVTRALVRAEERAAEQTRIEAAAPTVAGAALDRMLASFEQARGKGIKSPKMRLDTFIFSLAPATGKNAGAIYVKHLERQNAEGERQYMGKIAAGRFIKVRECSAEEEARIVVAATDPQAAALAYGQRTGTCSICGLPLTNAESIARSIGPICFEKYF